MDENEIKELLEKHGKENLEQIFQKAEVLDHFMNTSLFGMAEVSGDGEFLKVNDALCKILKKSQGELVGSTFTEITPEPMLSIDLANVHLLKSGGKREYILPKFYKLEDGEFIFVVIHVVSALKLSGEFDRFFVILLPVSQEDYEENQEEIIGRVILPEGFSTLTKTKWLKSLTKYASKSKSNMLTVTWLALLMVILFRIGFTIPDEDLVKLLEKLLP